MRRGGKPSRRILHDNRVTLTAADYRHIDDQHCGLCEDYRLSFQFVGQPFTAYILDATKVPMLDDESRQIVLDVLSSSAVFDMQAKKRTKVEKDELRAIEDAVKHINLEGRLEKGGGLANL